MQTASAVDASALAGERTGYGITLDTLGHSPGELDFAHWLRDHKP